MEFSLHINLMYQFSFFDSDVNKEEKKYVKIYSCSAVYNFIEIVLHNKVREKKLQREMQLYGS